MIRQSKTTVKELTAKYRSILKKCAYLNAVAIMGATFGANATDVNVESNIAKIGSSDAMTLTAALQSADSTNGTITLVGNEQYGVGHSIKADKNVTIDFGGNTHTSYAGSEGSTGTKTQAFQLLKGNTIVFKNGTIDIAPDGERGENGNFKMGIQNYSNLTLDNMIVDGTNLTGNGRYTISNNNGNTTIKNSTIIAKDGGFAFDIYYWPSNTYVDGVTVSVENSNIHGNIEVGSDGTKPAEDVLTHAVLNLKNNNTITGNISNANGTINVVGDNTINGNIGGTGMINVAAGKTLNIGTNTISHDNLTLDGTLVATVRDGDSQINISNVFDGAGSIKLALSDAGTYHIFGDKTFGNIDSSIYDLNWSDDGKDLVATMKSVESIAADNDLSADTANMVAGLTASTSATLNEISIKMQEALATGAASDKQAVEHAAAALNPEQASVVQSTTTSVQNTVSSLAANRMALPAAGRNGGDVELTAGGVWAQGLYNKSKMNGQFNSYTRGVAGGIDGTINKDITIGAGYAFNHSDVVPTSRDMDIDSHTVFVYGQYKPSDWYINATANYTLSDYDEKGDAFGTDVTADYKSHAFGGQITTGYDFAGGITPEFGLRYLRVNSVDYTNSLGIKNELKSADYLTAILGTKYGFNIVAEDDMLFRPDFHYALKYDLISDKSSATVAMPGVAAYTLNGDRLSPIAGEFGLGLTVRYKETDISLNYDIEVRESYTSQTGMIKARYSF